MIAEQTQCKPHPQLHPHPKYNNKFAHPLWICSGHPGAGITPWPPFLPPLSFRTPLEFGGRERCIMEAKWWETFLLSRTCERDTTKRAEDEEEEAAEARGKKKLQLIRQQQQQQEGQQKTAKWKVECTRLFDLTLNPIVTQLWSQATQQQPLPLHLPSPLPGLHHGPLAAVASLAKNGNVYMRVAQCHNVACIGYVPPPPLSSLPLSLSGCANVHVCVGNTFCVLLITWPGWPGVEGRGGGMPVGLESSLCSLWGPRPRSLAWWSLLGHCFLVVRTCRQL